MASEEQAKKSTKALSKWLENERRIVTFRELSRELGCHVNTAKNLLLSYQKSNPNIAPTYLLSGPLKSTSKLETTAIDLSRAGSPNLNGTQSLAHLATQGVRIVDMDEMSDADRNSEDGDADELDEMGMKNDDGRPGNDEGHADGLAGVVRFKVEREDEILEPEEVPKWGVVLVQADHLELKKELFEAETLNIHIYALSPAPVKDPGLYLVPNLALREHKKYHEPTVYGTTSGDGFGLSTAMKDGEMDFSTKAPKKEEPKDSKKAAVEEKTKKQVVTQPKKEVKEEKPTKATTSKTAKPVTKAASSTNVKAKPRKRVITSDNEDGDETDKSPAPVAQASGSKSTVLGPTSSTTRADDAAAMEAMMAMDMDNDSDLEEALRGGSSAPAKKTAAVKAVKRESSTTKTGGARKKRKVKRSVTEMNDKGYMVTRDEWIEESCTDGSEDETAKKSKPAAKPKATAEPPKLVKKSSTGESSKPALSKPPPKNIAGGVKKGGQSTLAGFFKKK